MDELNMSGDILKFDLPLYQSSYIKVIGVGGGGSNAVNHMYKQGINGVDFIVCNTDAQALDASPVPTKVQLGRGLGAGNVPAVAEQAAEEKRDEIKSLIDKNTQMLFITAGMGGGTGTGAAPVIASIAKEIDLDDEVKKILTVAIVTTPFTFEGRKRQQQAVEGIAELRKYVDAILIINNDKLREFGDLSLRKAFAKADDVLTTAAKGISEIITVSSYVQIDFKDVNTVMSNSGVALMGCGYAEGENRAAEAVCQAINSPLLNDNNINGAKNILLYISSGSKAEVTMEEIDEITNHILRETGEGADLIWGAGIDDSLEAGIAITLIATGFNEQQIFHLMEHKTHRLEETKVMKAKPMVEVAQTNEGLDNIMTKAEKERMEEESRRKTEEEEERRKQEELEKEEARIMAELEAEEAKMKAKEAEIKAEQEAQAAAINFKIEGQTAHPSIPEVDFKVVSMVEDWVEQIENENTTLESNIEEKMQREWEEAEKANAPLMEEEDFNGGDLYQMLGGLEIIEKKVIGSVENSVAAHQPTARVQSSVVTEQRTDSFVMESDFAIDLDVLENTQAYVSPQMMSKPDVSMSYEEDASERQFQASSITPAIRHRAERLRELSDMIKTQKGLEEIENVPAYLRRNVKLEAMVPSSVSEAPKHVLSMDGTISGNSFLHDNVD